jgi:hypothetical protein
VRCISSFGSCVQLIANFDNHSITPMYMLNVSLHVLRGIPFAANTKRGPGVHPKTDRDHDCGRAGKAAEGHLRETVAVGLGSTPRSVSPLSLRSPAARFRSWSEGITDTRWTIMDDRDLRICRNVSGVSRDNIRSQKVVCAIKEEFMEETGSCLAVHRFRSAIAKSFCGQRRHVQTQVLPRSPWTHAAYQKRYDHGIPG